jgi:hypothetical protein
VCEGVQAYDRVTKRIWAQCQHTVADA